MTISRQAIGRITYAASSFGHRPSLRSQRGHHPKDQADPPGPDRSPSKGEKRRRLGVKDRGMADREILDADPSRNLVVQNPIDDGRANAEEDDLQRLHEGHYSKCRQFAGGTTWDKWLTRWGLLDRPHEM